MPILRRSRAFWRPIVSKGKSVRTPSLMSAKSLAHLHATVVVEELRRCGVGVFCLSPGARAIPLVLALEEQPAVVTKLFNDERSAAFWAQGAAKGGVLPCLICTSGTAAANYLPAVVEASLAGTPMLVLTTDRPFELHYAKANQMLPRRFSLGACVSCTSAVRSQPLALRGRPSPPGPAPGLERSAVPNGAPVRGAPAL